MSAVALSVRVRVTVPERPVPPLLGAGHCALGIGSIAAGANRE
jgi:hypothetical protein